MYQRELLSGSWAEVNRHWCLIMEYIAPYAAENAFRIGVKVLVVRVKNERVRKLRNRKVVIKCPEDL
jgi:hypothetical protein